MKPIEIEKIKVGELFSLEDNPDAPIWVRSTYSREIRKYEAYSFDDINKFKYLKKGTIVYID